MHAVEVLGRMGVDGLPPGERLMPALPQEWTRLSSQLRAKATKAPSQTRPAEPCKLLLVLSSFAAASWGAQ